jgi:hypothetical protein
MRARSLFVPGLLAVLFAAPSGAAGAPAEGLHRIGAVSTRRGPTYVVPPKYEVEPPRKGVGAPESTPPLARPRIAGRPAKRTKQHLARFHLAGYGPFECAIDGGQFHLSGHYYVRRVSTGRHVLRVRGAGGSGPVATFRWRVLPRH